MYRLKAVRTRKNFSECTPDHRDRINRLLKRACVNSLSESPSDDLTSSTDNAQPYSNNSQKALQSAEIYSHFPARCVNGDSMTDQPDCFSTVMSDCNVLSDSLCNSKPDKLEDFEAKLARVFTEHNVTHVQARAVLQILKTHVCFSELHVDPRTILRTPPYSTPIAKISGGEYLHLGVERGLAKILASTPTHLHSDVLQVDFSTDEASLDKSSNILVWPIQIRVSNIPNSGPEIVGIFKGSKKPSSASHFFEAFVQELLLILQNGFQFRDQCKVVNLRCFIADAPARAFALGHRGHNARAPCSRCWVRGECVRSGVMIYKGIAHRLRTQEEYSSMVDAEHHGEDDNKRNNGDRYKNDDGNYGYGNGEDDTYRDDNRRNNGDRYRDDDGDYGHGNGEDDTYRDDNRRNNGDRYRDDNGDRYRDDNGDDYGDNGGRDQYQDDLEETFYEDEDRC